MTGPAAALAIVAGVVYVASLVLAPIFRPDLDVLATRPEHYASGSTEVLVRIGYLAVAVMMLAIAGAFARTGALAAVAALPLAAGGLMATALAFAPQEVTGGPLALGVLGLVVGPPLMTYAVRARLRRAGLVMALAIAAVISFVALAVLPVDVRGIVNRGFDALLGCWGVALASSLRTWVRR